MKKGIAAILFSVMALGFAVPAQADLSDISVYIDGKEVLFDAPPQILNGTTLVPMRKIFEELGATVDFDGLTRTISAKRGDATIRYTVGEKQAVRNGELVTLTTPGQLIDGATFVPLRFVSEALGSTVGWEQQTLTISISSANKEKATVAAIIDGDTLVLLYEDGKRETVNLAGVDAPEIGYGLIADEPYSREAMDFLQNEILETDLAVEPAIVAGEREGLSAVYLYKQDGTMLNSTLVIEGYARSADTPQHHRWGALFKEHQSYAVQEGNGLWASRVRTTIKTESDAESENGVPEGFLAETATYVNESIGFQVDFPGRWIGTRVFDDPGVIFLHISTRSYSIVQNPVWPYVVLYAFKPDDYGMTNKNRERLLEMNEGNALIESDVSVGGIPAKKLETDWVTVGELTGRGVLIVAKDEDMTFMIEYVEMKHDPEGQLRRMEEIIQSITFQ